MYSRWRQQNFFNYLFDHYILDALDNYATTRNDPTGSSRTRRKKALLTHPWAP